MSEDLIVVPKINEMVSARPFYDFSSTICHYFIGCMCKRICLVLLHWKYNNWFIVCRISSQHIQLLVYAHGVRTVHTRVSDNTIIVRQSQTKLYEQTHWTLQFHCTVDGNERVLQSLYAYIHLNTYRTVHINGSVNVGLEFFVFVFSSLLTMFVDIFHCNHCPIFARCYWFRINFT